MTEPTTRTMQHLPPGDELGMGRLVKQVSVPWCQTHKTAMGRQRPAHSGQQWRCWDQVVMRYIDSTCELLDPHAPDAVWKDTE